ncbi:MAG: 16S rRNA (adenine(1518)-N(6)/adenine(1519)-N(6))-dimethyltransferase RsmA [Lachnospiraceae bacterium]|jgi:16S rRNA (adenine1518-N6/adenine1519-N6)-dimethyltransferase|nr:16S rRNA (adenine(1518)-N(6)/adenine(1519)-N(6))-dimethyltransferase RsmA [Lachnospiraceae bacterium]
MAELGNPTKTIEVLKKYKLQFQKRYGQNFLVDSNILEKIIEAAQITKEDLVLEIGPGIGTMTQYLAEHAEEVIAVEIDKTLIPVLQDTLSCYGNVHIINEDILKVDVKALMQGNGRQLKIVANLPYYITTPIIMGLLESRISFQSITIMVQKEVADRMQAGPGTKDYGALSLAVQYYARPEVLFFVSPHCFMPRPNVESAVIRLTRRDENPVQAENEAYLFSLIRSAFGQRRKTLVNSLFHNMGGNLTKEQVGMALEKMKLSPSIRGEALTLSQFVQLGKLLQEAENL